MIKINLYLKINKYFDYKFLIENCLTCNERVNGYIEVKPFILTKGQNKIIDTINKGNSIIKKDRCVGISTLLSALSACRLAFEDNLLICFINPNMESMNEAFSDITGHLNNLKELLKLNINIKSNHRDRIELSNGNTIIFYTQNNSGRLLVGENIVDKNNWVIMDEAALYKNSELLYGKITNILYNKKHTITIASSQNGIDRLFFPIYVLGERAGFFKNNMRWYESTDNMSKIVNNKYIESLGKEAFLKSFSDKFVLSSPRDINITDIASMIDRLELYRIDEKPITLYDFNKIMNDNIIYLSDNQKSYEFNY